LTHFIDFACEINDHWCTNILAHAPKIFGECVVSLAIGHLKLLKLLIFLFHPGWHAACFKFGTTVTDALGALQ